MFIKQAYERRIEQQIRNQSPEYLKIKQKPPAIGSVKTRRLNFDTKEAFFGENDIPNKSLLLKNQTKQFKDPDILQLKKHKWNMSVQSPNRFDRFQDTHKDVLFKIKQGFFDHDRPVQQKSKKIEPGVETRDNYLGWNVSTQIKKRQTNQNMHNLTISSLQNTILFNQSMLKNYSKPVERYQRQRSLEKQKSLNESDLMLTFKEQYMFENPKASPQKTNASVFKLLEETRRQKLKQSLFVNQNQLQISRKFKANLSDSQKINISYKYVHNGSWSAVQWAQNGYAWSCCMNEQQNGKGCVKKTIDMNRPNFSSFNNA